jgi:hypothetical protein
MVACCWFTVNVFSQTGVAEGIMFQALARDPSGVPAKGRIIHIKDAILQSTATGTVVFSETFVVEASAEGVFAITIGKGNYLSGVSKLSNIDWINGPFFLNIQAAIEPSVVTPEWKAEEQYVDMGTSQFWTVPFAFKAASVTGIELLLKSVDTTSMLSPYLRKNDTTSLSNRINRSLKLADTSNMLLPYLKKSDTDSLSNNIDRSVKYVDTTNLLLPYLKKIDTVSISNRIGKSVKFTDTSDMLLPYLKKTDTVSLSNRVDRSVKFADTSNMLLPYLKKTDSAFLSNRIDSSLKYSDTSNMLSFYLKKNDTTVFNTLANGKLNIIDTVAMLSAYLLKMDTTNMLLPYLRRADLPVLNNSGALVDTFSTNLVVYATNGLGKYGPGQTIPSKGKTAAQVLMDVIMQTIPPIYLQPTVGISSSPPAGAFEIGSALNITLTASFTKNDAGTQTASGFSKNGSALGSNPDNISSLTASVSYTATVSYAQGAVKNNNVGTPDPTGQISAGSKTSTAITFTPQAKRYWGYSSSTAPSDADIKAALGGSSELSSTKAKSAFDITINGGSNYIFYAYPSSLGALGSLTVGGFGSLPSFTLVTRSFTNASGYSQSYNIYINTNAFSTPVSNITTN